MSKIRIKKDEVLYEGRFLTFLRRHFESRKRKNGAWEMTRRNIYKRIVGIVAITPKNELILIKIYRIPLKRYAIEIPAGLTDKKGENERAAARRELREETGYTARLFKKIAVGPIDASRSPEEMVVYLAEGARRTAEPRHDGAEEITTMKMPLEKLRAFLDRPPRGVKIDLKLYGILHLLAKHGYEC